MNATASPRVRAIGKLAPFTLNLLTSWLDRLRRDAESVCSGTLAIRSADRRCWWSRRRPSSDRNADFGDYGHVWRGNQRDNAFAVQARGGFSVPLGNPHDRSPMMVEVYTFPTGRSKRDGVVHLSLETEVTTANCGHVFLGKKLQYAAVGATSVSEFSLSMPIRDTVGDFLVLNNLFHDLKIAPK